MEYYSAFTFLFLHQAVILPFTSIVCMLQADFSWLLTETLLIGNWDCCAHYSISFTHFVRLYATWRKLLSLYFKGREITLLKSFIKFPCKRTSQASFLHMHIRWGFCVCVCDCAWRKEGRCTYRYHCGITSATKEKRMWQFLPQLSWLSEFLL